MSYPLRALTATSALILLTAMTAPAPAGNAFPGAVGFGTETYGGMPIFDGSGNLVESTNVIKVTNLNASGTGSLLEAVNTPGRRLVVFEVGGVIDMGGPSGVGTLNINQPDLTIAGHTAPGPGITIIRGGVKVNASDVVLRHLSIRPGDAGVSSGWEPDAISTGPTGPADTNGHFPYPQNVVLDHLSATWGVDENVSASATNNTVGPPTSTHNMTISNSIIAEGLSNASHSKGEHSKGTLLNDGASNIAHIANLIAHNRDRHPLISAAESVLVNNVTYNFGPGPRNAAVWARNGGHPMTQYVDQSDVTAVGNVVKAGPSSNPNNTFIKAVDTADDEPAGEEAARVYLDDNLALEYDGSAMTIISGSYELVGPGVLDFPTGLTPLPAAQTEQHVLANVGPRPWDRDPIDQRIVQSVIDGTGAFIDSQDEVGGYPTYTPTSHTLNVPTDQSQLADWLAAFEQPITMPAANVEVYRERFTADGDTSIAAVGWNAYLAEDTGGVADISTLGDVPGFVAGGNPDYAFVVPRRDSGFDDVDGPGLLFTTEPGAINIANLAELSVDLRLDGSTNDPGKARLAIRIDGQWYVSDAAATNDTNLGAGQPLDLFALVDFDFTDGALWRELTVALGEGTGALTAASQTVGGVLSGDIDAFGVYLEPGNDGDHARIDNFAIAVVPEPTTAALLGLTGAVMLAGRRRRN